MQKLQQDDSHLKDCVYMCCFTRSPWKDWQIGYLKNLQAADLRLRRRRFGTTNEMFLAYEVLIADDPSVARRKPLVLDTETIYNVHSLLLGHHDKKDNNHENDDDLKVCSSYVRGRLLGFVEITQRQYGLGTVKDDAPHEIFVNGNNDDDESNIKNPSHPHTLRPVLTNLAVAKDVRKYGIGSKLLDACEQHVRQQWKMHEIILEVEDYNSAALKFYLKRGYQVLFSDPASRRYDVQGVWLRKIRCRREVLRKVFYRMDAVELMESGAMDLFRRMREGWR
jgi:GNAT superfamily N-acetyltransferase